MRKIKNLRYRASVLFHATCCRTGRPQPPLCYLRQRGWGRIEGEAPDILDLPPRSTRARPHTARLREN